MCVHRGCGGLGSSFRPGWAGQLLDILSWRVWGRAGLGKGWERCGAASASQGWWFTYIIVISSLSVTLCSEMRAFFDSVQKSL